MARLRHALFVLFMLTSLTALGQSADQQMLSATDSPDPVVPGNNVTYTISIRNNGPDPAVNGGLNANISANLSIVSMNASAGFTCFALGNNLSCTNPSFPSGTTATFTIVGQVAGHLLNFPDGSLSSFFFTSGTTPDPNNGNNSSTVTTNYDSPQMDLALTVSDSPDPVAPDGDITYTVNVTNNGPDPASSVNFNVYNNNTLRFQSVTTPSGWSCIPPAVDAAPVFTCTNPSFAGGASSTFTVVLRAYDEVLGVNDGTVSAVFSVNGTGDDTNDNNNTETEETLYSTSDADMAIVSVTDSPDPVGPDGDITYTVQVANNGPDAATNATMSVYNNNSLRFQSVSAPGGWSCAAPAVDAAPIFSCTNPSFANAASATFTVVLRAYDEVLGINDGTVSAVFTTGSSLADPNNANNSETENTAYSTPDADLSVTASDSPDPITPDANITYTVTVINAGPDSASATLSVPMNGTSRFQSITTPGGFNCTGVPAIGGSASFSCNNPAFASGGNVVFTVVLSAEVAYYGNMDQTIVQSFVVTGNVADPNSNNNGVNVSTSYQVPDADLVVTNSDSPDPVSPGGTITYTQTLSNTGPDTAVDATISSVIPSSAGFVSMSAPGGFTCTTPAVGGNGAVSCTNPSFPNGASANFTLVVEVLATSGTVLNTAQAGSPTHDPDTTDNSAQVSTTILTPLIADLGITKSTTADSAAVGATVAYTITLTNNGPDAAANVVVTDNLPAELLFQSISVPAGFNCTTPAVDATGTITCTAATFASGATAVFTLVVELTGSAAGPINNTATASSDTDDFTPGNDSGAAPPVTVGGSSGDADLAISKTTATTTAGPGDTITYTISVTNNGPDAANDVVVTDTLPSSLLFQSLTPAAGFTCTTPAVGTTGSITCLGGPIANAATVTFTLVTTISPSASGSIANSASVAGSDADSNGSNSSVVSPGIVVATADVAISKTTNASQAVTGDTITYTITVSNAGPDSAQNVVVTDNLPSGLQFVSAVPSQGSCSGTDPFTCNLGTLAASSSATITLQVLVTATSGTISNTASVTSDTDDGDPADNSSTTPVIPVTSGEAIAPIPTLSEWMLLALATMLAAAAALKIRS